MEQITKKDGVLYYGDRRCRDIDEVYVLFRDDYNRRIGKAVYLRLDRLGQRKERVHGFGFVRRNGFVPTLRRPVAKAKYRLLGLCCQSYWWSIDVSNIDEDLFEEWVEYALTKDSKALTYVGRSNRKRKKRKQIITLNF